MAERLLDDDASPSLGLIGRVVHEPGVLQLLGHDGEVLRRDREIERMVAHRPALDVELVDGVTKAAERIRIVELAGDEADALEELLPRLFAELGAGVILDRVLHDLREVLVRPIASGEADQREPGRKQTAVGQIVHSGHELLAGQVAGHPEDHQRARTGDAVETVVVGVAQRVVPPRDLHGHMGCTIIWEDSY